MRPYENLTHQGRLRRMRRLALAALGAFGIEPERLVLLRQAGNTLFRVYTRPSPAAEKIALFEDGQYLLRVHEPGYQQPDALDLELTWLAAMRRDADLPVPEPVPAVDGRLMVPVSAPGVPGHRNCSLLRWVRGRLLAHRFGPHHLEAQGRLMARLHDFATRWQSPPGLSKRRFDWDGLFQHDVGSGMSNADAWSLLPPAHRDAFARVAERVADVMRSWGEGPDVWGLVHGDLAVDANLLFWHGEPRAIDFDDSGFGYWAFDLAVALDACRDDPAFPRYREALLRGYTGLRPLPERQSAELELFLAAVQVYWNLWATGGIHLHPELRAEHRDSIASTAEYVVRYAAHM